MSMVVLFDLGDTLVVPRLAGDGSLQALTPFPFVPEVLGKLGKTKVGGELLRLGVISNTGQEPDDKMRAVMAAAGLLGFFDAKLLFFSSVEHLDKRQKEFFQLAAERAGAAPDHCVYVGEDAAERQVAAAAGFRTSYHPLHVFHVIGVM